MKLKLTKNLKKFLAERKTLNENISKEVDEHGKEFVGKYFQFGNHIVHILGVTGSHLREPIIHAPVLINAPIGRIKKRKRPYLFIYFKSINITNSDDYSMVDVNGEVCSRELEKAQEVTREIFEEALAAVNRKAVSALINGQC